MNKEKKDATNLMINYIVTHYYEPGMCDSCLLKNDFCNDEKILNRDACIKQLKQYFQQHSYILDIMQEFGVFKGHEGVDYE